MTEQYPPYNHKQEGKIEGIAIDLLATVFNHLQLDAAFDCCHGLEVMPCTRQGRDEYYICTTRTEEREPCAN